MELQNKQSVRTNLVGRKGHPTRRSRAGDLLALRRTASPPAFGRGRRCLPNRAARSTRVIKRTRLSSGTRDAKLQGRCFDVWPSPPAPYPSTCELPAMRRTPACSSHRDRKCSAGPSLEISGGKLVSTRPVLTNPAKRRGTPPTPPPHAVASVPAPPPRYLRRTPAIGGDTPRSPPPLVC